MTDYANVAAQNEQVYMDKWDALSHFMKDALREIAESDYDHLHYNRRAGRATVRALEKRNLINPENWCELTELGENVYRVGLSTVKAYRVMVSNSRGTYLIGEGNDLDLLIKWHSDKGRRSCVLITTLNIPWLTRS